ncbi:MAG: hypothetical protein AB1700_06105 [Bacillota bacterium]
MGITSVAREFIEVNQRRKELEKQEECLKEILIEHFRATKTTCVETDIGKVSYLESQKADYDIPALRQVLPETMFNLVTKVSVNDAVLSQLIKDGKVDPRGIERARKVTWVYRVVVKVLPGALPVEPPQVDAPTAGVPASGALPRRAQPRKMAAAKAPVILTPEPPSSGAPGGHEAPPQRPPGGRSSAGPPSARSSSVQAPARPKTDPGRTLTPPRKAPAARAPESLGQGSRGESARREEKKAGKRRRTRNPS